MVNKALLVLEKPWWTPVENPKRASVLTFMHGLEKVKGNFNLYYSNFYERESFISALLFDLTFTREDRLFLYIAAHGSDRMIGSSHERSGMHLTTMLAGTKVAANFSNIEGVVVGSCNIGVNVDDNLAEAMTQSSLAWMFAYTCEVDWLMSTLIDIRIFENLMQLRPKDLERRNRIISAFARALSCFDGEFILGEHKGREVKMRDAITLMVHLRGRGKRPRDETVGLLEALRWNNGEVDRTSG